MQDVGQNMLYLHKAQQLQSLTRSYLLPMAIDAELDRQFPLAIDLNKILPDLLKLRTKAEKPDIQYSQDR